MPVPVFTEINFFFAGMTTNADMIVNTERGTGATANIETTNLGIQTPKT